MSSFYSSSGSGGGGTVNIPQLYSDPVSPAPESAWVLAVPISVAGSPIGLALALTYGATMYAYQFSYRTLEGITIRVPLV